MYQEWNDDIHGVEIIVWREQGNWNFDLSPVQLQVVFKALGFKLRDYNADTGEYTYSMYGDDTLTKFLNGKWNPFKMEELTDE